MKKIALVMSGNLRKFFFNNNYIAQTYVDFIRKQNVDIFIYTDDNDFYHNGTQYFSNKNTEKIMGIPALY